MNHSYFRQVFSGQLLLAQGQLLPHDGVDGAQPALGVKLHNVVLIPRSQLQGPVDGLEVAADIGQGVEVPLQARRDVLKVS